MFLEAFEDIETFHSSCPPFLRLYIATSMQVMQSAEDIAKLSAAGNKAEDSTLPMNIDQVQDCLVSQWVQPKIYICAI